MADDALAPLVAQQLQKRGIAVLPEQVVGHLPRICALFKDRCDTTVALADWAARFYADITPNAEDLAQHVTAAVKPALNLLLEKLTTCAWDKTSIAAAIKEVLVACGIKMPLLAMPVRVLVLGSTHTPSLDAVLELCAREKVLKRLRLA